MQRSVTEISCSIDIGPCFNQSENIIQRTANARNVNWTIADAPDLVHVRNRNVKKVRQTIIRVTLQNLRRRTAASCLRAHLAASLLRTLVKRCRNHLGPSALTANLYFDSLPY